MRVGIIGGRSDGHAGVILDVLLGRDGIEIVCIFDSSPELFGKCVRGIPIVGNYIEKIDSWIPRIDAFHIAIGDNRARVFITNFLLSKGLKLLTIQHPSSIISPTAVIGDGCFIGPNVVVQTNVKIGMSAIINTGVIVEHDCDVGSFVHLAPGVVLAGRVRIKEIAFLGIGSLVTPDVTVGYGAFAGAGSVITKDVEDEKILLGFRATIGDKQLYERVTGSK